MSLNIGWVAELIFSIFFWHHKELLYLKTHKKVIIHLHSDVVILRFLLRIYVFSHDAKLSYQLDSTEMIWGSISSVCTRVDIHEILEVIWYFLLSILFNYYEFNLHGIKYKLIFYHDGSPAALPSLSWLPYLGLHGGKLWVMPSQSCVNGVDVQTYFPHIIKDKRQTRITFFFCKYCQMMSLDYLRKECFISWNLWLTVFPYAADAMVGAKNNGKYNFRKIEQLEAHLQLQLSWIPKNLQAKEPWR